MADFDIEDVDWFHIDSTEDALLVIHELEEEVIKLYRRIDRRLSNMSLISKDQIESQLNKLASLLDDAFRIETVEDYTRGVAIYGKELADSLYGVQLSFSNMKIAVIRAAAPIVQVLLPVVQTAISALTGLANSIGQVLRMLLLGSSDAQDFSQELSGVVSVGNKLKKTLAGFDQINRLMDQTSTGGGLSLEAFTPVSGNWEKFAGKLTELFKPLKEIDLTPAAESLERLKKALEPITKALFAALEWAWYNILVPLGEWAVEELLPVFLDTLTASLEALGRVIQELKPYFLWLWENYLKPLAQWKADQLIQYLQGLTENLKITTGTFTSIPEPIAQLISSGKELLGTFGDLAQKALNLAQVTKFADEAFQYFSKTAILSRGHLSGTGSAVEVLLGLITEIGVVTDVVGEKSTALWETISGVWGNAWSFFKEKLTDPAAEGMKNTTNGIIGMFNGMLSGVSSGVNALGQIMNKFSFTLPDWLPLIGGKGVSFSFPSIQFPQIPLLAKGAVLPANKPFMAVVGDQKHGTNIEAPLTTIQEAVSLVMEDYVQANMAGHQATVGVLRELLSAVLGIRIGDEMIAGAVKRYDRKMAVVTGGY